MKEYTILFSIYGKKLKATVKADTEDQARNCIRNKISFDKITEKPKFAEEFLNKYKNTGEINGGDFMDSFPKFFNGGNK